MAENRSFHLVTPVWGRDYTDTFVEVTLPSILAPGNAPSLPLAESVYKIFTSDEDAARIRTSPAFRALSSLMPVEIRPITHRDENPYVTSSSCYRTATAEAVAAGAIIVYLIPDMILGDGSLSAIARFLREGKRAVMVGGMRAVKETIVPQALARFKAGDAIAAPPRALVELALEHLHPIMQDHFYESDRESFNPSFFCWPVGDEGYVIRCAHLHPVAVDFRGTRTTLHGTIDDDLLFDLGLRPEELAFAEDSDDVLWFEISTAQRTIPPATGKRLWEILRWLNGATYPHQREYLKHTLRVHRGETDGAAWSAADGRASRVIDAILGAFELERERIARAPGDYAMPTPIRIGDSQDADGAGAAIEKIMDAAGAAVVVGAVSESLEKRARSYMSRGASRRLDRSVVKRAAALAIIAASGAFRALLRRIKRR